MNKNLSPRELAEQAVTALRRARPDNPQELFQQLVERGWINADGEVTRLLGGDAEPELTAENHRQDADGQPLSDPEQ